MMQMDDFKLTPIQHKNPEIGEYLVIFTCVAELVDSKIKQDILRLLTLGKNEVEDAISILEKHAGCTNLEATKLAHTLCTELSSGKDRQEILNTPHEFIARVFYYGKPEDVPLEDKRWSIHPLNFTDKSVIDNSSVDGESLCPTN